MNWFNLRSHLNWMVQGEVRHRANRPRLGGQGERMLKGVNIARYYSGFSSPFLSFFIMSQFASLTDEERRDKMTMLRSIILFFYTRLPGFIIIFIHPHMNIPRSEV